jgi:hypothetical protein
MRRTAVIVGALALVAAACGGNVFDLEVGDCFNDPEDFGEVTDVKMVDCAVPHDNEVFAVFDLPDGDYPGSTGAETSADGGCIAEFAAFVGIDYDSTSLDVWYLYPTEDSWNNGDREVVCMLFDPTGTQLTGTAANSGL